LINDVFPSIPHTPFFSDTHCMLFLNNLYASSPYNAAAHINFFSTSFYFNFWNHAPFSDWFIFNHCSKDSGQRLALCSSVQYITQNVPTKTTILIFILFYINATKMELSHQPLSHWEKNWIGGKIEMERNIIVRNLSEIKIVCSTMNAILLKCLWLS